METFDPRVDAYIAKSGDFAKPILNHIRNVVHQAFPDIKETVKWGMPFFDHKGPVCHMAAFKQHLGFGFWKASRLKDTHKVLQLNGEPAAGSFGRVDSVNDLPADEILIAYVREAVKLNEEGIKGEMKVKPAPKPKAELVMPTEFVTMLSMNSKALTNFQNFSPSKQREYIEWFVDAKAEATRQKRMEQAIEWITEGKSRHWKYQS